MSISARGRWILVLLACLAVCVFSVVYPIRVIWPFRTQHPNSLMVALAVLRFRPLVTVAAAIMALLATVQYWRVQPSKWRRALALIGAALTCLFAFLARVNIYELMFHHLDHPEFAAASEVTIDKDDKLIVVKIGGTARAYPIRTMGYHHVVNDVVGGTAIVATY
jgi:hypothetical protein